MEACIEGAGVNALPGAVVHHFARRYIFPSPPTLCMYVLKYFRDSFGIEGMFQSRSGETCS